MSTSWRSGKSYDVIRAERDAELASEVARICRNDGAVELSSYPGYFVTPSGCVYSTSGRKLTKLRPGTKPGGYNFVGLSAPDGSRRYEMVHRLVASAFVPNPKGHPEVNHKDLNKTNNSVENLEWVTRQQNTVHAYSFGAHPTGAGSKSRLTFEQVALIRDASGAYRDIGAQFGISCQTVCNIKRSFGITARSSHRPFPSQVSPRHKARRLQGGCP